jgi:hypothetical protein
MTTGNELTISTITNVRLSFNLEETNDDDDGCASTFKYYRLWFANRTYLQLETLVTLINLRFSLEHSKYPLIRTIVMSFASLRSHINCGHCIACHTGWTFRPCTNTDGFRNS